ncbi:MAG: EamA family transporter [Deltaproteobacteria bacterium CG03_land_8_20_14_0_80_45_14]|nr:MAG: EamA family transporter [Deltaproteobacteria bacterium CG03_land_8_20_14_0_80_45_14]
MRKNEARGYLYILIGTTLWGVSSVVAKSLFIIGLPPAELVQIRLTIATFTLLLILILFDRKRIIISLKDLPYFLVLGFVGVAGVQFTYYYTISKIHVGPAVLIQYLSPIWIALYAFIFQKEPLTKGKMIALFLAILGCYFTVGGYRMDLLRLNRIGIMSGLISSLFFSFYALYGEKGLKKYDSWTLILYGFGFGAVFYWILISPMKVISEGYSFKIWMAFLYIAIFSTLIPFGLYFKGIEQIRATRASITATWEPVVAGMTAYFVLGEILFPLQVLGGIGVIAAIVLLQMAKEKAAPSTPIEIRQKE